MSHIKHHLAQFAEAEQGTYDFRMLELTDKEEKEFSRFQKLNKNLNYNQAKRLFLERKTKQKRL